MTIETYYTGIYWGIRQESAQQCAQRAAIFFEHLAQYDPLFVNWFKPGRSREEALKHQVKPEQDILLSLLLDGKNRTDFGHSTIKELGFRINLWASDSSHEGASLSLKCGCYSPIVGLNSCVIELPAEGSTASRILRLPVLTAIMDSLVSVWEPDWGVVNSHIYRDMARKRREGSPLIGWITYLTATRGSLPLLPPTVEVRPVGAMGSLIIVSNDRFTASNPIHVERADHIAELLDQAGVLRPLK